jgi:hypothetical protein
VEAEEESLMVSEIIHWLYHSLAVVFLLLKFFPTSAFVAPIGEPGRSDLAD